MGVTRQICAAGIHRVVTARVVLASVILTVGCSRVAAPPPRLVFPDATVDLGAVPSEGGTFQVRYTNQGGQLLRIESVAASCSCTLGQTSAAVEPGQEGVIAVVLSRATPGRSSASLQVRSNDPTGPHLVGVTWFGLHGPRVVPPSVAVADLAPGELFSRQVRVVYAGGDKDGRCRFKSASADTPGVQIQYTGDELSARIPGGLVSKEVTVAGELSFTLTGVAPVKPGECTQTCTIAVEQVGKVYELKVPVSVTVVRRLTASPADLSVLVSPDIDWTKFHRTVLLGARSSDSPVLRSAPDFLACAIEPMNAEPAGRRMYHLRISAKAAPPTLPFRGEVVVTLPGSDEDVRIPVMLNLVSAGG